MLFTKKIIKEVTPKNVGEAKKIIILLREGQPLLINVSKMDKDSSAKLFDFITGASIVLDAKIKKIESKKYFVGLNTKHFNKNYESLISKLKSKND